MGTNFYRSRSERAPVAPPNVTIYNTPHNYTQRVSRRELKGAALVSELSNTCLDAMREYRSAHGPMSSAIEQLEWLSPTLSQQLQIIELANDPEIEPMKGLIIGTLADIAVSIRALIAAKNDGSDEKIARLEQRLSDLLKSEEVESEVLDEPPYAEGETNGTGLKDIVESCGRDIESLVSTLADLEPVFHPNEVRHERRSKWADSIAIKELDPRPSRSRRVQVQTPFEYRERVVEEFDNPYHVEHRIHETRRMSPTRPMLYRTFNTL